MGCDNVSKMDRHLAIFRAG